MREGQETVNTFLSAEEDSLGCSNADFLPGHPGRKSKGQYSLGKEAQRVDFGNHCQEGEIAVKGFCQPWRPP